MFYLDLVNRSPSLISRASNGAARQDNRLALLDQTLFAGHRAAGIKELMQVLWLYEHPIDFDGLRRFHHNFGRGLLGRRIECSPLPFARHRWVSDRGPEIDIAECARPRAELSDWADERSQLPVDPVRGPGWHLGVLPLTDGSTAVSLVISHYLLDGLGLVVALLDALQGNTRDLGYPPPRSRTRLQAVLQDARQTARDAPEVARALVATVKQARKQASGRPGTARSSASRPVNPRGSVADDDVVVPGIAMSVDADQWDARANALGGNSSTLAAALAAKFGERMGRRRASDGAVTLQLPISERAEGDTRAVAVTFARVSIDPMRVTTDLRDARAAINQALTTLRETPTERQPLWLVPLIPKWGLKRMVDAGFTDPDRPVFYSNLGDLGSVLNRLDGTDAEYQWARGPRQGVTRLWLERTGGQVNVLSLRIPGKVIITVLAYQPGGQNTKSALRELAARTLAEFDLTGKIE
ncbi:hypothetical protein [Mycobacterium fragae]|uniref:hypothetical protein n=1 Tax=Mycobacterium fragae TaxID=1260918 RepID=UPI001D0B6CB1|nr:hypothetical protein [Mycobacterium fragae]